MPTMEESYRLLLEKLVRFRDNTAAVREAYVAGAANEQHSLGSRRASWHKAKVLGSQFSQLDYTLARNREQAAVLGVEVPSITVSPLGVFPRLQPPTEGGRA